MINRDQNYIKKIIKSGKIIAENFSDLGKTAF